MIIILLGCIIESLLYIAFRTSVMNPFLIDALYAFYPSAIASALISSNFENFITGLTTFGILCGVIALALWLLLTGQVPEEVNSNVVAKNTGIPWNRDFQNQTPSISITNNNDFPVGIDHATYDVYDCPKENSKIEDCETYPSLGREDFTQNNPNGFIIKPHTTQTFHPQINTPSFVQILHRERDEIHLTVYKIKN